MQQSKLDGVVVRHFIKDTAGVTLLKGTKVIFEDAEYLRLSVAEVTNVRGNTVYLYIRDKETQRNIETTVYRISLLYVQFVDEHGGFHTLPLKHSQWQAVIQNRLVESNKPVYFIVKEANGFKYARLIPERSEAPTYEDILNISQLAYFRGAEDAPKASIKSFKDWFNKIYKQYK